MAGTMLTRKLSQSLTCAHGSIRREQRPASSRFVKDVRGPPHTQPCTCPQAATEVYPDDSDYIDLSEFGLEGAARVGPVASTAAPQMETRIRIKKQGHCYGCGVRLQTREPNAVGFVDPIKFTEKLIHRQTDKLLCLRCNELCHGKMVPAVEDFAQKGMFEGSAEALTLNGKALISPEDLRRQLLEVGSKKALVLMLVDLLDVSGTLMTKVRDLVGRNPIILIGTKMDLLPAGCQPKAVAQWLMDAAMRKRLNVVSAHLVSSHTMEGISAVASKACAERKGRDVYVIGAANVGKSAFVRAFLNELRSFQSRNFDAAALSSGKYLPIESAMPGTTLGLIPLQAFASGGTLYDSPGVHLHHRVPHMLSPEELKMLQPRKKLCVYRPPAPAEIAEAALDEDDRGSEGLGRVSATYEWSDLVRVDVLDGPPSLVLVFHGPHSMQVTHRPLQTEPPRHDVLAQPRNASRPKGPKRLLSCAKSVALRGGLVPHDLQVSATGGAEQAVADIAVSGLPGWVTLWASHSRDEIKLRVWSVRGVEVFLRPAFPTSLPEQLVDDITTGDNRPPRAGKMSKAGEEDTSERVKQIFRRYQVEEVKEEEDGPDANELLAMLKKEVEELETVAPGSQVDEEDVEFSLPESTGRRPPAARQKTGKRGAEDVDDLSALFGTAMEEVVPASSGRAVDGIRRMDSERLDSSSRGQLSNSGIKQSRTQDTPTAGTRGGNAGNNTESAAADAFDLSSLFGAALEGSIQTVESTSLRPGSTTPQRRGVQQLDFGGDALPEPGAVSTSGVLNKSRTRARQMADERARSRGTYDRPHLFPDTSLLSQGDADALEPTIAATIAATASTGVSVSDLAAKYTALSQPKDMAGSDAPVGEKSGAEEETFVLDEDLVREIAAQAKAGAKRRRRPRPTT